MKPPLIEHTVPFMRVAGRVLARTPGGAQRLLDGFVERLPKENQDFRIRGCELLVHFSGPAPEDDFEIAERLERFINAEREQLASHVRIRIQIGGEVTFINVAPCLDDKDPQSVWANLFMEQLAHMQIVSPTTHANVEARIVRATKALRELADQQAAYEEIVAAKRAEAAAK